MNSDEDLKRLIKFHLDASLFNEEKVVEETAFLFSAFVDNFVKIADKETFYSLPYKHISVLVFENKNEVILSNSYEGFTTTVKDKLEEKYSNEKISIEHIIACYEKFVLHIELAQIQKQFILKAAHEADIVAEKANLSADEARKNSKIAKEESEKAKKTYNDMMVNYITILGIFASIIITIFGGMQIISATSKLLQTDISLITLVFVLTLLTLIIIIILGVLLSWISNIKNDQKDNPSISYAIIFLVALLAVSGLSLYISEKFNKATAHILEADKSQKE